MGDGYDSFDLVWCERTIVVRYQVNWLNSDHCHIELRCAEVAGHGNRLSLALSDR